jgi:hypothetical protein
VRIYGLLPFALFLCVCGGCSNGIQRDSFTELLVPDVGNGWLSFNLEPEAQRGKTMPFRATYEAEGKTARFDLEVTAAEPSGDPPITFTSGRFSAVPGSDASVLLRNLRKTLEAKNLPSKSERVKEIPFTAAILGTHQSHAQDGGFFTEPKGNWTCMKIFIGKKDDPAEVFLNFNLVLHKGEFSIKDSDYGDDVLRELAKVL